MTDTLRPINDNISLIASWVLPMPIQNVAFDQRQIQKLDTRTRHSKEITSDKNHQ